MKAIILTKGKIAGVDDEDFERVEALKWYAAKMGSRVYAHHRFGKRGYVMPMHRLIMKAPVGMEVDHRDGDGLNNSKENLRLATKAQNGMSFRRKSRRQTSKYRGVSWMKRDSIWVAQVGTNGKNFYLGRFLVEEDAARAYDIKAKELFGEFVQLNFV